MKYFLLVFCVLSISEICKAQKDNEVILKGKLLRSTNGCTSACLYELNVEDPRITKPNLHILKIIILENQQKLALISGIVIDRSTVNYIPKDFPGAYTKITRFKLVRSHLKEVQRRDIAQFKELRDLELWQNELEVIEGDLFQSNLMLEKIYLGGNRIKFIGKETFNNLRHLSVIKLFKNKCIDTFNKVAEILRLCYNAEEDLNLRKQKYDRNVQQLKVKIDMLQIQEKESFKILAKKEFENNNLNESLQAMSQILEAYKSNQTSAESLQQQINVLNEKFEDLFHGKSEPHHDYSSTTNAGNHIQTFIMVMFFIILLIVFAFIYFNRSKILVMSKSYTIPNDDEIPCVKSSETLDFQLSVDDFTEQSQNEIISMHQASVAKPRMNTPPIPPKTPSTSKSFIIEADVHPQGPKVPAKNSVLYSSIKKKLEEEPNSPYGRVWKTNQSDDEYVELQKKGHRN